MSHSVVSTRHATKPGARRAEPALLRRARTLGVPVVAIGGITAANGRALVAAGADAIAVVSAVFDHDNPGRRQACGRRHRGLF